MALRSPIDHYTPEEYLALERAAEFKSEYIDGEIVAMTGGSRAHSLIATNVARELGIALRHQPCEVHGSDLRVTVEDAALYTYPDVTVICGEPVFEDDAEDTLMNPVVIVEVLSPSTEAFDRGKKFARFRLLPSLRAYVLVSQDQPRVEWYTLGEDGWLLHEATGLDGLVHLTALGTTLLMAEIYAKVKFEAASPAGP